MHDITPAVFDTFDGNPLAPLLEEDFAAGEFKEFAAISGKILGGVYLIKGIFSFKFV